MDSGHLKKNVILEGITKLKMTGKDILLKSIRKTSSEKLLYLLVSCFLLLLLLLTFFPLPASTPSSLLILADVCFFLVRSESNFLLEPFRIRSVNILI